jgi:hypothetical protein
MYVQLVWIFNPLSQQEPFKSPSFMDSLFNSLTQQGISNLALSSKLKFFYFSQQLMLASLELRSLFEGTSIAGFAVKKSAGLICSS